jgi:tetratricopeptide (TPR) repeat protein
MRVQCLLLPISLALIGLAADAPAPELAVATELELKGDLTGAESVLLGLINKAEAAGEIGQLSVALNNLAVLYVGMERHTDAERYFNRTMRMVQSNESETAKYVHARTTLHLAWLYIATGRVRDAEKLNVSAISDRLRAPDDQARTRSMLAVLAMFRKDLTNAEDMFLGVLSYWQLRAPQVKVDAEIATAFNNLGLIAWRQGRIDTALSRLHQSLALWRGIVEPDNPTLAKTMSNIAMVYSQQGGTGKLRNGSSKLSRPRNVRLARRTVSPSRCRLYMPKR